MKYIVIFFLTCAASIAQRGVSYDNNNRNVLQTNLNQTFGRIGASNALARQFISSPIATRSGAIWEVDVGEVRSVTAVMDQNSTLVITGTASSNSAPTIIQIITPGGFDLNTAGLNISGLDPEIVPEGVQWMWVVGHGGTNFLTLDWKESSTNGFRIQTDNGFDIDPTDYFSAVNQLQGDVQELQDNMPDLRDGPWSVFGENKAIERMFYPNTGSTIGSLGDSATASGTAGFSSPDADQWPSINYASVGLTGNTNGINGGVMYRFKDSMESHFTFRLMETGSVRVFIGVSSITSMNNATGSTNPAASFYGMFYDSSQSPNWWFSTKDGTTLNAQDTGVAANTLQNHFSFRYTPNNQVVLLNDGNEIAESTDNLPLDTATGRLFIGSKTLSDEVKNIRISRVKSYIFP